MADYGGTVNSSTYSGREFKVYIGSDNGVGTLNASSATMYRLDIEGITLPTFLRTGNPTATKSGSCVAQVWDENGYHATSAGGGTFSIHTDSGDNTPFLNCKQTGFSGLHNEGPGNIAFVIGDPSIAIDAEL